MRELAPSCNRLQTGTTLSDTSDNPEIEPVNPVKEPTPAPKPMHEPDAPGRGPVSDPEPDPTPDKNPPLKTAEEAAPPLVLTPKPVPETSRQGGSEVEEAGRGAGGVAVFGDGFRGV